MVFSRFCGKKGVLQRRKARAGGTRIARAVLRDRRIRKLDHRAVRAGKQRRCKRTGFNFTAERIEGRPEPLGIGRVDRRIGRAERAEGNLTGRQR